MFDIATLLYYAAMGLALIGADAYWYADSIVSKVEVGQKFAGEGLSSDFATTLFSHELQQIYANESIIRSPQIRAANDQSVVSVIAASLSMDELTVAFQQMLGLDPVQVKVALLDDGKTQQMLITSTSRTRPPFSLLIPRKEKESMPDFIGRAAIEVSCVLEPYHTALYLLEKSDVRHYLDKLKSLLETSMADIPAAPDNRQRAMYRNLQGIVALVENDSDGAGKLFELAVRDTNNYSAALLNLGFVRIQQDRHEEALAAVRPVIEHRAQPHNHALHAAAYTISGVANWALGRTAQAERDFAQAAKTNRDGSDMYEYWGRMLDDLGRKAEAERLKRIGAQNLDTFEQFPEIALLYFWLAEKKGQPLTRRTQQQPAERVVDGLLRTAPSGGSQTKN